MSVQGWGSGIGSVGPYGITQAQGNSEYLRWFDVTAAAYGADPTGVADSTTAFNAAVTAAAAAAAAPNATNPTGIIILVPAGLYTISSDIIVNTPWVTFWMMPGAILRQQLWGASCIQLRADDCAVWQGEFRSAQHTTSAAPISAGTSVTVTPGTLGPFTIANGNGGTTTASIASGGFVYLGDGAAGELLPVLTAGSGVFTVSPTKNHVAGCSITCCANITGANYDGWVPRNRCAAVYLANGNRNVVDRINSYGLGEVVSLRGNTSSPALQTFGNRVTHTVSQGACFGVLGQQQNGATVSFNKFSNLNILFGANPSHGIYFTGNNLFVVNGTRNTDITVIGNICINNPGGAGFELKFIDGVTALGNMTDGCARGMSAEGCVGGKIDGSLLKNFPNLANLVSAADLASANGTSSTPTVTSGTYSFTAFDVGAYLVVASGTNWTPGTYIIGSVSGGGAVLTQAVGTAATLSAGVWTENLTLTPDTLQVGLILQDCRDLKVSNAIIRLINDAGDIQTTDSTDNISALTTVQTITVGSTAGASIGALMEVDAAASYENVIITAFTPTTVSGIFSQAHNGTVTAFQVIFVPPTDGIIGIKVGNLDSSNAGAIGASNCSFSAVDVIANHRLTNSASMVYLEGSGTTIDSACKFQNLGAIHTGSAWYIFQTSQSAQSLVNQLWNSIDRPTIIGNTAIFKNGSNMDQTVGTFDLDRIFNGTLGSPGANQLNSNSISNSLTSTHSKIKFVGTGAGNGLTASAWPTLSVGSASPTACGLTIARTKNTVQTLITSIGAMQTGQRLDILGADTGYSVFVPGSALKLAGPWISYPESILSVLYDGNSVVEVGRFEASSLNGYSVAETASNFNWYAGSGVFAGSGIYTLVSTATGLTHTLPPSYIANPNKLYVIKNGFSTANSTTILPGLNYGSSTLSAATATTTPVVSDTAHVFVASDVGTNIVVTAGTNWTPGTYKIVSVAAGSATLNTACGSSATLTAGTYTDQSTIDGAASFTLTSTATLFNAVAMQFDPTLNTWRLLNPANLL